MQELLDIGFAHDRTTGKEDWLTPPEIISALGPFDLDPCSPMPRPWDTAAMHYTMADNGLLKEWLGRVWLNPPYGNETPRWMERLAKHGNGIALIFARTETRTFHPWVWKYATGLLWLKGRIRFYTKEGRQGGTAGAPSVLIAFGEDNAIRLQSCGLVGHYTPNVMLSGNGSGRKAMTEPTTAAAPRCTEEQFVGRLESKLIAWQRAAKARMTMHAKSEHGDSGFSVYCGRESAFMDVLRWIEANAGAQAPSEAR